MVIVAPHILREGPSIPNIINSSLTSGIVSKTFNNAVVQPLVEKPTLNTLILFNFRPISKLTFLLKILEKIVLIQLQSFLDMNGTLEIFQSGFKALHSTECSRLKVFNDLLLATDSGDSILLLSDVPATFDTVDYNILISCLEQCIGIRGTVLEGFRSYLSDRSCDCVSSSAPFQCGVRQGSVLRPGLFCLYLLPLGSIIRKYSISFHCYVDDTQIYLPLKPENTNSLKPLLDYLKDVKSGWCWIFQASMNLDIWN